MNWTSLLGPIVELLLRRGNWISAVGMFGVAIAIVAVGVAKGSLVLVLEGCGAVCGVTFLSSLFLRGRRNSDMIATGVAEIKEAIPGKTQPSADPAIQSAQVKLQDSRKTGEVQLPIR